MPGELGRHRIAVPLDCRPPTQAELTAAYDNVVKESYKFGGDLLALGAPEGQEKALVDVVLEGQRVTERVEKGGQEAFFADEADPYAPIIDTLVHDFGEAGDRGVWGADPDEPGRPLPEYSWRAPLLNRL